MSHREYLFRKYYCWKDNLISLTEQLNKEKDQLKGNILLSYCIRDENFAKVFEKLFENRFPQLRSSVNFIRGLQKNSDDSMSMIVLFLSNNFFRSRKDTDELHVLLSQVRTQNTPLYVIIINELPITPSYVRLINCDTCISDSFWSQEVASVSSSLVDIYRKGNSDIEACHIVALMKAAYDVGNVFLYHRFLSAKIVNYIDYS